MNEKKHATRVRKTPNGDAVEFTNARDEDGILVDATIEDVERMGREAFLEYQARRDEEIAAKRAQAEEEERFERFEAEFVRHGGTKSDAAAAYKAMRNEQAATAARQADNEALYHAKRNIRSKV